MELSDTGNKKRTTLSNTSVKYSAKDVNDVALLSEFGRAVTGTNTVFYNMFVFSADNQQHKQVFILRQII